MLPKNQEKEDSSSLVYEELKQLQGETQSGSPNKASAIIGMRLYFVIIIYMNCFSIESTPSAPKLLAWCSGVNNKISIIELETKQEFVNFDGVKLSEKPYSIFQPLVSDSNSVTIH